MRWLGMLLPGLVLLVAVVVVFVGPRRGADSSEPATDPSPAGSLTAASGSLPAATPDVMVEAIGTRSLPTPAVGPQTTTSTPSASHDEPSAAQVRSHIVAAGETAEDIARQYGIHVETLFAANAIADPDLLLVGQELRVPEIDGVLHVLAPGESLRQVAARYDVPLGSLIEANGLRSSPDTVAAGRELLVPGAVPVPVPPLAESSASVMAEAEQTAAELVEARVDVPAAPRTYVVREGDSLRSVAEAFGLDILTLIAANGVDDPDLIVPGRELRILPVRGLEHVVQPGETLAAIATRYEVDATTLLEANGLADPDLLRVGIPLIVPGGTPRSPAPPAPVAAPRAPAAEASQPRATPDTAQRPAPTATPKPQPPRPTATATSVAPAARAAAPVIPAEPSAAAGERVITAKVTGYALGAGASGSRTASGTQTRWGTVAADTRLYPFGTRLTIEGFPDTVFVVEDTGSAVRGNIFDIWFPDVAAARRLGTQTRHVTILSPTQ
jgi:LysM repeat protein/3D (Asp-Asp-Asp) domain-containing protein